MYRASEADSVKAWESARRPKLVPSGPSMSGCGKSSSVNWCWTGRPNRFSGWLKIQYPKDKNLRVSHETRYRSLFIQARGNVLKKS